MCEFINKHPLSVISTVDADGYPCGATIYTGADNDFNIYFMTKSGTVKSKNIDTQSVVSLTYSYEPAQATLQLSGTAAEIYEQSVAESALQVLRYIKQRHRHAGLPVTKLTGGSYILYKVTPDRARLSMTDSKSLADTMQVYEYYV